MCKQESNLDVSWQVLRWPRATSLWEHYSVFSLLSAVTVLVLTLSSRLAAACFPGAPRHPWLMRTDVPYWVFQYLSPNPMKLDSVASNVHCTLSSREKQKMHVQTCCGGRLNSMSHAWGVISCVSVSLPVGGHTYFKVFVQGNVKIFGNKCMNGCYKLAPLRDTCDVNAHVVSHVLYATFHILVWAFFFKSSSCCRHVFFIALGFCNCSFFIVKFFFARFNDAWIKLHHLFKALHPAI